MKSHTRFPAQSSRTWLLFLLIAAIALLGTACGDDDPKDGGDSVDMADTTGDVEPDEDAMDVEPDEMDVQPDTDPDTQPDVEPDTDPDTDPDLDPDMDPDMTPDGDADMVEPAGPWNWCVGESAYVGNQSWARNLTVTEEATYCGLPNERFIDWMTSTVLWEDSYNNKTQMWFAPGEYPLPVADGTYPFRLPFCVKFTEDGTQPVLDGTGELQVTTSSFGGTETVNYVYTQPMAVDGGDPWTIRIDFSGEVPETGTVGSLDGSSHNPFGGMGELYTGISGCSPNCGQGVMDSRVWDSCHFESYATRRHNFEFEGGNIQFDLRYGVSAASTEPGQFVYATGQLDGTSIDETDYWELVYTPAHHHFTRHFFVRLDPPVGNICGLAAEKVDEDPEDMFGDPAEIVTYDCSYNEVDKRKISNETFQLIEP